MKLHVVIERDETGYYVAEIPRASRSCPQHRELGVGLLKKLIKHAQLTVDEFNDL
ncbi:MAG: hypothetical protein HYY90_00510 [Candidatus Omnitrophica bacterium]|nr:hypothetical protein [Candidatus Omnitrophota bacterium]MBI3020631.1 hypothetical protein [Candidatus Omnitrophota bacterium]MBI3082841.1 hypothetical protein [Candidatus Omnitrophota bacterium]